MAAQNVIITFTVTVLFIPLIICKDTAEGKLTQAIANIHRESRQPVKQPPSAYLGDPCGSNEECFVPNRFLNNGWCRIKFRLICKRNTNLYWNGQSFCECADDYVPRTGSCFESGNSTKADIENSTNTISEDEFDNAVNATADELNRLPFDERRNLLAEKIVEIINRQLQQQKLHKRQNSSLITTTTTTTTTTTSSLPKVKVTTPVLLSSDATIPAWMTWIDVEPKPKAAPIVTTLQPQTVPPKSTKPNRGVDLLSSDLIRLIIERGQLAAQKSLQNQTELVKVANLVQPTAAATTSSPSEAPKKSEPLMATMMNINGTLVCSSGPSRPNSVSMTDLETILRNAAEKVLSEYLPKPTIENVTASTIEPKRTVLLPFLKNRQSNVQTST